MNQTWLIHPSSFILHPSDEAAGKRMTNSLPWPGPSLWALTSPPCSWTSERTRFRPIPSPIDQEDVGRGDHGRRVGTDLEHEGG
jgi:hypothetical protein